MASWMSMTKTAGSGSICLRHGSADPDPDPNQNIIYPEHCSRPSRTGPSPASRATSFSGTWWRSAVGWCSIPGTPSSSRPAGYTPSTRRWTRWSLAGTICIRLVLSGRLRSLFWRRHWRCRTSSGFRSLPRWCGTCWTSTATPSSAGIDQVVKNACFFIF